MDTEQQVGKISTFSSQQLVGVEYPGFIQNADNMLKTLGGTDTVARTFFQTKDKLELRFRPSDPSCKAACANLSKHHGVLLHVKRKRKRKGEDGKPGPWHYEQSVKGIVNGVYRFEGLMDFQYLTPVTQLKTYQHLFGREILNADEPFFPIPKLFARIDTPGGYHYRGTEVDVNARPSKWMDDKNTRDCDTKIRKERKGFGLAALYDGKSVPHEPLQESHDKIQNVFKKFPMVKSDADHLKELFEERPCWQRGDIERASKLTREMFKQVLPCFAYYWINGPWSRLWCRMGYDPREHPEAYIYQQCECRIKYSKNEGLVTCTKKSVKQRKLKQYIGPITPEQMSNKGSEHWGKFGFHPDRLPDGKQFKYQLCDIHDDEVQQLIKVSQVSECTEKDGYLIEGTLDKVREILKKRIAAGALNEKGPPVEQKEQTSKETNDNENTEERGAGRDDLSDEEDD